MIFDLLISFNSCLCNDGFFGNGTSCYKGSCTDDLCPGNEQCLSAFTFDCECVKGFTRNKADSCVDIDECQNNEAYCNKNADCLNMDGSYKCSCNQGYFGDGESCLYGQCLDTNCPQNMTCVSPTTSDCKCKTGFTSDPNSENCVDIDECEVDNLCETTSDCINTLGSYSCESPVLVLSSSKPAVVVNPTGEMKELPCFSMNSYDRACSLSWKNRMYVFGMYIRSFGHKYKQISRLDGYQMNSVGELNFDHYDGACSTMNDQFIFLCFSQYEPHKCRRATDPLGNFTEISQPNMNHLDTRISASRSKSTN